MTEWYSVMQFKVMLPQNLYADTVKQKFRNPECEYKSINYLI